MASMALSRSWQGSDQLQSALAALTGRLDVDGGAGLREAWTGRVEPKADDPVAVAARLLLDMTRSRQLSETLAGSIGGRVADVVMVWAECVAARRDLVLAPVIVRADAHEPYRSAAACARLAYGPLFDALHSLPAAWGTHQEQRLRLRQLIWEAGARGLCLAELGRWLWRTPDAIEQLVHAPSRGHLGERILAARALAVFADGFTDETSRSSARLVVNTAVALRDDPDPAVWGAAARALGRLSAGCAAARIAVFRAVEGSRLKTRRRNLASIASIPVSAGTETWVRGRLQQALAADDDPWALAAIAVATPHLARERPDVWDTLCKAAIATEALEIKWSLAQGLAVLARHSAGHGWVTSEQIVARSLRDHLVQNPPSGAHEIARQREALLSLDRALGEPPEIRACFDEFDARLRADIEGEVAPEPTIPRVEFEAALSRLGSGVEAERGDAMFALRSASRAQAMHLSELVLGLRTLTADTDFMFDACTERLGSEVGDYALRYVLTGVLADLISADVGQQGRLAARSLRAVAGSRWAQQLTEGATEKQVRRDVQRFRKPLQDLIDAAIATTPLAVRADEWIAPPPLRAWWILCAGAIAVLDAVERVDDPKILASEQALLAALEAGAAGEAAATWGPRALHEMERLGAANTALGTALAQSVRCFERLDAKASVVTREELQAACHALAALAENLDDALAPDELDDLPGASPDWSVRRSADTAPDATSWNRLSAPMRAIVQRAFATLERHTSAVRPSAPRENTTFGAFTLIERIGAGGMGEVWRATWLGHRPVALKLPRADIGEEFRERLAAAIRAEAAILAPLVFARVATLLDCGVVGDTPYLATSFIRGRTVDEHLIEDPDAIPAGAHLPLVRRVLGDICIGLDNLHRHGLVHRDLKPGNVMLRMRGRLDEPLRSIGEDPRGREIDEAVLIDFGIAHQFNLAGDRGATPGYASPEAVHEQPVGPAADIYALGALIFHLMTGTRLCGYRDPMPALVWHAQTEPFEDPAVVAAAARMPADMRQAVARACRRDPHERLSLEELRALISPDL